jgi:hypothetical protein
MGHTRRIAGVEAPTDPLRQLLKLKSRLEQKLSRNSDYRALVAIEHAIAELDDAPAQPAPPLVPRIEPSPMGALSHVEAVTAVLTQQGEPLAMRELVTRLRQKGVRFVGKDPKLSLSATLSRSRQFRSVSFEGERCWWFSDRPLPHDRRPTDARQDFQSASPD